MFDDQISCWQRPKNSLPRIWLFSDQRSDATLEKDIMALPHGAGVIFRHYHLQENARKGLFNTLKSKYARASLCFIWSGDARTAQHVGADGVYGLPASLLKTKAIGPTLMRLTAVHNLSEIAQANALGADIAFCSPVFATRTHADARTLGVMRFAALARYAHMPVCALGGITHDNFSRLAKFCHGWGAIDGLSKAEMLSSRQV